MGASQTAQTASTSSMCSPMSTTPFSSALLVGSIFPLFPSYPLPFLTPWIDLQGVLDQIAQLSLDEQKILLHRLNDTVTAALQY